MNHQRSEVFWPLLAPSFPFSQIPPPLSVFIAPSLASRQLWGGIRLENDHTAAGQTRLDSLSSTDRKTTGGDVMRISGLSIIISQHLSNLYPLTGLCFSLSAPINRDCYEPYGPLISVLCVRFKSS